MESHDWLQKLIDDQTKLNENSFNFGHYDSSNNQKIKFKNVIKRKKRFMPLTTEDRLKEIPSIYSLVAGNKIKKIESTKNIFSNIIKNFPREN